MARVLVIDDNDAVRQTVKSMLEHEGIEVIVADNGRSGVETLEGAAFDLAIVDLFMPGMDGIETIKALHQRRPSLPIIAISGSSRLGSQPDFLTMATKLGAAHGLSKPFGRQELMAAVRTCLDPLRALPPRSAGTRAG